MIDITTSLQSVRKRVRAAEQRHGRAAGSVRLLAVSKTKSAELIREAVAAGQRAFGESYVQESEFKLPLLRDLDAEWHYIGPIQSNKTRTIARLFDWVQSVDRAKIALRLNEQRPAQAAPLQVCLQVNISQEAQKAGVDPAGLSRLAGQVAQLPKLRLRGLMAIPAQGLAEVDLRRSFAALAKLFHNLRRDYPQLDTLSMGMSADLEAAIAEGSSMVRIGTAVFGPRERRTQG